MLLLLEVFYKISVCASVLAGFIYNGQAEKYAVIGNFKASLCHRNTVFGKLCLCQARAAVAVDTVSF